MSVYYINSYDIDDPATFEEYPPLVADLIKKYGGEVLVSDTQVTVVEGSAKKMNAIVKFPSKEAALRCYNDPEYQKIKKIRIDSTSNTTMVLANEFVE